MRLRMQLTGAGLQHAWGSKTTKQSKQATWRMSVRAKHKRVRKKTNHQRPGKEISWQQHSHWGNWCADLCLRGLQHFTEKAGLLGKLEKRLLYNNRISWFQFQPTILYFINEALLEIEEMTLNHSTNTNNPFRLTTPPPKGQSIWLIFSLYFRISPTSCP